LYGVPNMQFVIPQPLKLLAWYGTQKISDIPILSGETPDNNSMYIQTNKAVDTLLDFCCFPDTSNVYVWKKS